MVEHAVIALHPPHWCRLMRCIVNAVLGAFAAEQPVASAISPEADAAAAPASFRSEHSALQHHALALCGAILHADPTAIHVLRGAGVWELAYGPACFFFGQVPACSCSFGRSWLWDCQSHESFKNPKSNQLPVA